MVSIIYPISCSWVWGGGFLSLFGFKDYAGSGVVHLVGGVSGLVHTLALGPRLGFSKTFDKKKFYYGRDTVKDMLLKLEMFNFDRDEKLK
jgi:ammonia channel protein AmtB